MDKPTPADRQRMDQLMRFAQIRGVHRVVASLRDIEEIRRLPETPEPIRGN